MVPCDPLSWRTGAIASTAVMSVALVFLAGAPLHAVRAGASHDLRVRA